MEKHLLLNKTKNKKNPFIYCDGDIYSELINQILSSGRGRAAMIPDASKEGEV